MRSAKVVQNNGVAERGVRMLESLLKEQSKEKLIEFILDYSTHSDRFKNAVEVRFASPDYDAELQKMQRNIDEAFNNITDYRSRNAWGDAIYDISHILAEIEERKNQWNVRLAFSEAEMLYIRLLESLEFQGECEISDEADYVVRLMDGIIDNTVSVEDGDYIAERCRYLAALEDGKNYGVDHEVLFIEMARKCADLRNSG